VSGSCVETSCADGVGRVLLNRPEVMNAVNIALAEQLEAALRDLGTRDDVRVIVLRGAGGHFCAGGDFHEVQRLRASGPAALAGLFGAFRAACTLIAALDVPVVAAVEGNAMAGGFELVQAVDIALASDTARLSDNHVNYGQVPGGGSSQRLPRILGRQRALAHLLSGERLSGVAAAELGLVHRSYPAARFDESVEAFVAGIAAKDPVAVRTIKRLVRDGAALRLEAALDLEQRTVIDHITGQAGADGVRSFASRTKEVTP
jgi:enoyl-CoA hydratase/carnithine racemase